MAHPYYNDRSESFDEFIRTPNANNAFPTRRCVGEQEQQPHIVHGSRNAPPSSQSDVDNKIRPSTRKRIQVACGRCRKRKIRCSGDPGDGSGCTSCRTAGATPCNFLRVNSSLLQAKHNFPPFDYPSSAVSPAMVVGRVFTSPIQRNLSYSRSQSLSDLGSLSQSACPARGPYAPGSLNYDEDCSSPYGFQAQPCMPPSSSSSLLNGYYASPSGHKAWNPSGGLSRTQSEIFFTEHDGVSFGPPLTMAGPHPHTSLATDVPSLFPAISSLSGGEGSDRTLPTPTGQQPGVSSASTRNAESSCLVASEPPNKKRHCGGKGAASILSKRPMESTAGSVSLMSTSRPTLSTQPNFLCYASMPTIASPVPVTPATYNGRSEAVESGDSDDGSSLVSRPENGLVGLDNGCIYGYSLSGPKAKNRSDPLGTLMNGQQYTRLRRQDLLPPSSYDFLPPDAGIEYHTSAPQHDGSISVLNNRDY